MATTSTTTQDKTDAPYFDGDVFGRDGGAVIMSARGAKRVEVALTAIEAIAAALLESQLNYDCDDKNAGLGPNTVSGLIQAIGVCADFASDHLSGNAMSAHYCTRLEDDDPNFARLESFRHQVREETMNADLARFAELSRLRQAQ